jgi:hypothetical protein
MQILWDFRSNPLRRSSGGQQNCVCNFATSPLRAAAQNQFPELPWQFRGS